MDAPRYISQVLDELLGGKELDDKKDKRTQLLERATAAVGLQASLRRIRKRHCQPIRLLAVRLPPRPHAHEAQIPVHSEELKHTRVLLEPEAHPLSRARPAPQLLAEVPVAHAQPSAVLLTADAEGFQPQPACDGVPPCDKRHGSLPPPLEPALLGRARPP
eukprot:CAMPEP_0172083446 /NCGR_PEP_ID=MMETSP1043-20130122/20444_1 /TAXON_ID=464988 /ORGANISM="Hemiselmis andersenii, Strain CCMP441" /LENGTH=160 /DNA_ID=CAMNT_0012745163 /DNA_START=104 /DNA_END=583 /DNA_ORIENTATION=+